MDLRGTLLQGALGAILLLLAWPGGISDGEDFGRWIGRALFPLLAALGLRALVRNKEKQPLWSPWVLVIACVIALVAKLGMAQMEA